MLDAMGLPVENDSVTFPRLGNTGSVALPLTVAAAIARGEIESQQRVAMLGIGSGINSVMLATTWGDVRLGGNIESICDSANPVLSK